MAAVRGGSSAVTRECIWERITYRTRVVLATGAATLVPDVSRVPLVSGPRRNGALCGARRAQGRRPIDTAHVRYTRQSQFFVLPTYRLTRPFINFRAILRVFRVTI